MFRRLVALLVALTFAACGGAAPQPPATSAAATQPVKLVVGFSEVYQGELALWYAAAETIPVAASTLDPELTAT